jgi:predicted 3-demethylubiquinone-9 3-methyltransferase (glyoxalase superfamily)
VSFAVNCKDQAEIDYYWQKLSKVPEAEQCGWCKDQFGLSWQIVPENWAELTKKPGAFKTLMSQHKIIISEY